MKYAIGVDLGATNTRIGLVSPERKIIKSTKVFSKTPQDLVRQLKSFIDKKIEGIGIGAPGPLNLAQGRILATPNLISFRNVPIVKTVKEHFQTKVFLERDTNVALLGELVKGAAQNYRNVVMLTLGTGVGGAILINGKLYHGTEGLGGEIGHMKISDTGPTCACGNIGDLEAFLGVAGIREEFKISQPELISQVLKKEKRALEICQKLAEILGIGIGNIINIFDPQLIIIGGGLAKIGEQLAESAKITAKKVALVSHFKTRITTWQLGDDGPVFGAAMLVFEGSKIKKFAG